MLLAKCALQDLMAQRLDVVLAPAPRQNFDGHCVRVAQNQNPGWYTEWRGAERGHRDRVIKALKRVMAGRVRPNGYEVQLLPILKEWAERCEHA